MELHGSLQSTNWSKKLVYNKASGTILKRKRILQSINVIVSQLSKENRVTRIVIDYDVDNFSLKVVRVIISYIDYVNRTVWYK